MRFHSAAPGVCSARIVNQEENDIGAMTSFCGQRFNSKKVQKEGGDLPVKSQGVFFVCVGDSVDCGWSFAGCCGLEGFG